MKSTVCITVVFRVIANYLTAEVKRNNAIWSIKYQHCYQNNDKWTKLLSVLNNTSS